MATSDDRARLEALFPNLAASGYEIRSEQSASYNCLSYAIGIDAISWDPFNEPDTYWPAGIKQDYTIGALVAAYRTVGFVECDDGEPAAGFEKIAIYGSDDGTYSHAAVLRENGMWASKLGELEDIEHGSLDAILCEAYGTVRKFMARRSRA
jgi:hypothetical protein